MSNTPTTTTNRTTEAVIKWLPYLVIIILIATAFILWKPISILMTVEDAAQLRAEVDQLGLLAPIAYFALSIIQIVGAPIPGYPVQLLGGALFGPMTGAIYAIVGMIAGGLIAAWLARTLGRPFIEKQVPAETLAKYENLAKLESMWVWIIILLIPLGDFPYYIAGLSRVKFVTLALAILFSRAPFTIFIVWVGATSVEAPIWVIWVIMIVVISIVGIGFLSRNKITQWMDRYVLHRLE